MKTTIENIKIHKVKRVNYHKIYTDKPDYLLSFTITRYYNIFYLWNVAFVLKIKPRHVLFYFQVFAWLSLVWYKAKLVEQLVWTLLDNSQLLWWPLIFISYSDLTPYIKTGQTLSSFKWRPNQSRSCFNNSKTNRKKKTKLMMNRNLEFCWNVYLFS